MNREPGLLHYAQVRIRANARSDEQGLVTL